LLELCWLDREWCDDRCLRFSVLGVLGSLEAGSAILSICSGSSTMGLSVSALATIPPATTATPPARTASTIGVLSDEGFSATSSSFVSATGSSTISLDASTGARPASLSGLDCGSSTVGLA